MHPIGQALTQSFKSLRRAPRFTLVVVLTLALGVGATSAIFSVLNAVLLRPLPFPEAKRVVHLAWSGGGYLQALSAQKFQYWQEHARTLDAVATWQSSLGRVDFGGDVSTVHQLSVTRDFLRVVGSAPTVGRALGAQDHLTGAPGVALISHGLWRTRFGGSLGAIGAALRLDGTPRTIVGVLPESFAFPYEEASVDVIVPVEWTVDPTSVAEDWPTIARLRPGVRREQAEAEVASLTLPFRAAYPHQADPQDRGMSATTFSELYVAAGVRQTLWILLSAVSVVLLIACANVANLFLARAAQRRREITVRAALGATRARIVQLVLGESVLVALAAGALGLMVGQWVAGALVALAPTSVARMGAIGVDWRVLLFTFGGSLGTSLFFGSAAAWPAARAGLSDALKESARGSSGRSRMRQGLLVAQSALAMVLLVGAGLLVATLIGLTRVDPGFQASGLVAVRIPSKPAGYAMPGRLWDLEQRVEQQLAGDPVVTAIAAASSLPLERGINTPMTVAGHPELSGTVEWRSVSPGYFPTLGIAIQAGRGFEAGDRADGLPVAIVNAAFASRYFPGISAIGQRIEVGRFKGALSNPSLAVPAVTIVGIVSDIREVSLRAEPRRTMYVPAAQAPAALSSARGTMPVFLARSSLPGPEVERRIAEALRLADPALPAPQVFSFGDVVTRSLIRERFGATLLSALAMLALVLTATGIYSVLAYTVQQRRREIGIRMALGAAGRQVTGMVMSQGIAPVLGGVLIGLAGSLGLSRLVASYLWGVAPTDPETLAAVAALLVGVAVMASWIPAREAARGNPVETLNSDS